MIPVSSQGRILIMGSKPSNFAINWLNHPRLVFWHSGHKNSSKFNQLPKGVEVVVFTRFVGHSLRERIQCLAKRVGVNFFRYVQNTGEIKRYIGESGILNQPITETVSTAIEERIVTVDEPPEIPQEKMEEVVIEETTQGEKRMVKKGELKKLVLDNLDLTNNSKQEIDRLFELAKISGLDTTRQSIGVIYYQQRKASGQSPESSKIEGATPKPVTRKRSKKHGGRHDSVKAIEEFLSSAEIMAVAVKEIMEEMNNLREENQRLKGTIKQFRALARSV